jgi:hypothetical protein
MSAKKLECDLLLFAVNAAASSSSSFLDCRIGGTVRPVE